MKTRIFLILVSLCLFSCGEPEKFNKEKGNFQEQERKDKIPSSLLGTWALLKDKHKPVLTVTDTYISYDFTESGGKSETINFESLPTTNYNTDYTFSIKRGEDKISLGFGTEGIYKTLLTLTINNECIERLQMYVPKEQPEEPVEEETPIIEM